MPLADAEIQRICAKVELISCRYFADILKWTDYLEIRGGSRRVEERKRMAEEDSGSLAETAGEGQLAMTLERN